MKPSFSVVGRGAQGDCSRFSRLPFLGGACDGASSQAPKPAPLIESTSDLATIGPTLNLLLAKSTLLRLPDPIERLSIGNPTITDVTLISKREIYFLGKAMGTTNVIVWSNAGQATVIDVTVNADLTPLENELKPAPRRKDITVLSVSGSIVLRGTVSDAVKVDQAIAIAEAWRARRLTRDLVLPGTAGQGSTTISVGAGGGAVRDRGGGWPENHQHAEGARSAAGDARGEGRRRCRRPYSTHRRHARAAGYARGKHHHLLSQSNFLTSCWARRDHKGESSR